MKTFSLLILSLSQYLPALCQDPKLTIEGHYQGQNIYVQNPFHENGTFCTTKVLVNGHETKDSVQASAYEIDLSLYGFTIEDPVKIEIFHLPGCTPKVLPPQIINVKNFHFKSVYIDDNAILHWTLDKPLYKGFFKIESYQWNKWITIGEIMADSIKPNQDIVYSIKFHSGTNRLRIRSDNIISKHVEWKSSQQPITYKYTVEKNEIQFSDSTHFEIYNTNGDMVKKDFSKSCIVEPFAHGTYYLHYDNTEDKFVIERTSKRKKKKRNG